MLVFAWIFEGGFSVLEDRFTALLAVFGYTIAAFGYAFVVGHSKISLPAREKLAEIAFEEGLRQRKSVASWFLALIECPACIGFWIGLFSGAGLSWYRDTAALGCILASVFLAFYTCGMNFILARLTNLSAT